MSILSRHKMATQPHFVLHFLLRYCISPLVIREWLGAESPDTWIFSPFSHEVKVVENSACMTIAGHTRSIGRDGEFPIGQKRPQHDALAAQVANALRCKNR